MAFRSHHSPAPFLWSLLEPVQRPQCEATITHLFGQVCLNIADAQLGLIILFRLVTNLVNINFDVVNPTDAHLAIDFVQADASVNGEIFAHFDQSFSNFVVPARGTANSGTFGNVLLTQGALNSLGIIPLGELDISAAQTGQCVLLQQAL